MSPFAPFIVLLCNVVETYNLADLELLGAMIESIEAIRESMPTISQHLRLFKPLFEVASKFVEVKTAPVPRTENFNAFLLEANMDLSFEPALLSTFSQGHQPDVVSGQPGNRGTSFLDVWSYLDSCPPR